MAARNRAPPGGNVVKYAAHISQDFKWLLPKKKKSDFIFLYIVFHFHGLLAPFQHGSLHFPRWYKDYRALTARTLRISLRSREWQALTEAMVNFPAVLRTAMKEIVPTNILALNNNLLARGTERYDRLHVEYGKLWTALQYHPGHWQSPTALRALLADISGQGCRYDVPLFSQYASWETAPASKFFTI